MSVTVSDIGYLRKCMVEELGRRKLPPGLTVEDFEEVFDEVAKAVVNEDHTVVGFVIGGIYKYLEGKSGRKKANNW